MEVKKKMKKRSFLMKASMLFRSSKTDLRNLFYPAHSNLRL